MTHTDGLIPLYFSDLLDLQTALYFSHANLNLDEKKSEDDAKINDVEVAVEIESGFVPRFSLKKYYKFHFRWMLQQLPLVGLFHYWE